jgi:pantothenate kinase type III
MTIQELRAEARSILTETQIQAFGLDLRTKAAWLTIAAKAKEIAAATAEALTSDTAKSIYAGIAYFMVVLVVGLWLAAVHNWKTWVKPGAIVVGQWFSREFQHWLSLAMLAQYE